MHQWDHGKFMLVLQMELKFYERLCGIESGLTPDGDSDPGGSKFSNVVIIIDENI